MPQEPIEPYGPRDGDYRYRVTATSAEGVVPPAVPGEVESFATFVDRASAEQQIEIYVARADLGRIILEERLANDVQGRLNEWRVIHSWTRTAEGWRHQ